MGLCGNGRGGGEEGRGANIVDLPDAGGRQCVCVCVCVVCVCMRVYACVVRGLFGEGDRKTRQGKAGRQALQSRAACVQQEDSPMAVDVGQSFEFRTT